MRYAHTVIRTHSREVHVGDTYIYVEDALVVEARLIEDKSDDECLVFHVPTLPCFSEPTSSSALFSSLNRPGG